MGSRERGPEKGTEDGREEWLEMGEIRLGAIIYPAYIGSEHSVGGQGVEVKVGCRSQGSHSNDTLSEQAKCTQPT